MDLQSTPLKGIVRSSEDGLFYLFPIQSLSTLQEMKGHLTCAIDVLSNPDENDTEKRLDAVRTLNSLVAALSVNDGDYYDAIDIAFEESKNIQIIIKAFLFQKRKKERCCTGQCGIHHACLYNTFLRFCMDERSLRFRRNGNVLSTDNDAAFIPLSRLRIRMEELHPLFICSCSCSLRRFSFSFFFSLSFISCSLSICFRGLTISGRSFLKRL